MYTLHQNNDTAPERSLLNFNSCIHTKIESQLETISMKCNSQDEELNKIIRTYVRLRYRT